MEEVLSAPEVDPKLYFVGLKLGIDGWELDCGLESPCTNGCWTLTVKLGNEYDALCTPTEAFEVLETSFVSFDASGKGEEGKVKLFGVLMIAEETWKFVGSFGKDAGEGVVTVSDDSFPFLYPGQ
jgi:hypothetical protein